MPMPKILTNSARLSVNLGDIELFSKINFSASLYAIENVIVTLPCLYIYNVAS